MKNTFELSLRPYKGRLLVATTRKAYEKLHNHTFGDHDRLPEGIHGRFAVGGDENGMWTCIIWADNKAALVHELSHVVLDLFERCSINPIEAGGEPFCYLMEQLFSDCLESF